MNRVIRSLLRMTALVGIGAFAAFTLFQLWWLDRLIDDLAEPSSPHRFFAQPLRLEAGQGLVDVDVDALLVAAGLRPAATDGAAHGTFTRVADGWVIRTRAADQPPAATVRMALNRGRILLTGAVRDRVVLAPTLIEEDPVGEAFRVWRPLEAMPPVLLQLAQALEDRRFAHHPGVDGRGLLRAVWVNLTRRDLLEGGSTITQQLVKSRYLTAERSLWRKYNEILLALLLERRHGKARILEAYLNDVYLGQQQGREIRGFPQAARHYFGRPLEALRVEELALLVGMLRGPSWYNPWRNPERARARRDRALRVLYETGFLAGSELARRSAAPLGVRSQQTARTGARFPAYLGLVRRQLRRGDDVPRAVPTGLDLRIQLAAERALDEGLRALAARFGRLQGAVVVANRRTGVIEAAVGGVPVTYPGFNRVIDARRQVGSVIKPVYYGLALARSDHDLLTPLADAPVAVTEPDGRLWEPENFDGKDRGQVPLVEALSASRNRASVQLGLALGVDQVVEALAELGWQRPAVARPSLLLGALELSPLEVAQLYVALSRDAHPLPLTAIARRPADAATTVPITRASYLLGAALVHAVEFGTGRSFAPAAVGELAGKTGTTNDGRDAWFAGWTAEHVLVVWVGRDDNAPADLSGAAAAGPVVQRLLPALVGGPVQGEPPAGVRLEPVDLARGRRIDAPCPGADHLPFATTTATNATLRCPR